MEDGTGCSVHLGVYGQYRIMPTDARGNYLPKPPYLRETKTYHSPPVESIRYDMLAIISSRYQYGPFLFFCCRSYVKLLDY